MIPCCNQIMTQLTNGAHQSSCNPGNNTSVLNRRWKDKVKPEDPSILYFIHKLYILAYLLSPGPCSLDTACSPGSAQTSWRKVNCQHVLDNLQYSLIPGSNILMLDKYGGWNLTILRRLWGEKLSNIITEKLSIVSSRIYLTRITLGWLLISWVRWRLACHAVSA